MQCWRCLTVPETHSTFWCLLLAALGSVCRFSIGANEGCVPQASEPALLCVSLALELQEKLAPEAPVVDLPGSAVFSECAAVERRYRVPPPRSRVRIPDCSPGSPAPRRRHGNAVREGGVQSRAGLTQRYRHGCTGGRGAVSGWAHTALQTWLYRREGRSLNGATDMAVQEGGAQSRAGLTQRYRHGCTGGRGAVSGWAHTALQTWKCCTGWVRFALSWQCVPVHTCGCCFLVHPCTKSTQVWKPSRQVACDKAAPVEENTNVPRKQRSNTRHNQHETGPGVG